MTGHEHLPVIVFLHGFTGSSMTWIEVMDQLKVNFRIIAVDLTGDGKTDAPKNPDRYSMDEQVKNLAALCSTLNLKKISLVGYSIGGRIALSFANRYPKLVQTLILESA